MVKKRNDPLSPEEIKLVISRFKEVLPQIIEMAIQCTDMAKRLTSSHIYFGLAQIPQTKDEKLDVQTTQIMPPPGATYFPIPQDLRGEEEPRSLRRVLSKCRKLGYYFVRLGHTSAFDHRIETRGMPEGEWGGAFVVGDGTIIVGLSGLSEKLCEAVLLVACAELGLLTLEEAALYSRPRPPGGVPHGHGRRYYDQFFAAVSLKWEDLKSRQLLSVLEELDASGERYAG